MNARYGQRCLPFTDLPGPVLNARLRSLAARRISAELRRLADGADPRDPATWLCVARRLGITILEADGAGYGAIVYVPAYDTWVLVVAPSLPPERAARVLVHEMAHYLEREKCGEWITGGETAYHYAGPADDFHHEIAMRVEKLVVR